uniref:Uncharacterized protein n=1 Tax=Cajanus cajan TaxID=3821 RepID=A0A151R0J8_CAJCA|nr:hypothetical protein KK1_042881 [Cajanus cajan]
MDDRLKEMLRDVGPESFKRAHMYETMCNDLEKPLYPNCTKFTRLSAILRLFNLKARNGWSDKSFTEFYDKIHVCPTDCILYRNEYVSLDKCLKCNARLEQQMVSLSTHIHEYIIFFLLITNYNWYDS